MSLFKTMAAVTISCGKMGIRNGSLPIRPLLTCAPVALTWDRGAHTQDITKNIQYITNEKIKLTTDPKTMKLDKQLNRPTCVMINWLLARQKHVMKYANLYLEQGFDVISVSCTPWQLIWPLKGSQLVAADLIKFMAANENDQPTVLHGFSVGGYIWGEVCVHIMNNKEKYHLKTFHDAATVHYIRSSQLFHTNLCRAPALFLLSASDPVGAERSNRSVYDSWCKMGIKCTWQCWDRSPHVQHFSKHRDEYVSLLRAHLQQHVSAQHAPAPAELSRAHAR
ncbi:uncharacterized protein LOC125072312 isoform X2 [Vanessa atalanta]|uniref:uncharacterized protein LOC125072312 isoform X2 n=1 Tax=Vanessa atalanta TaxID=42275 RepID=UPI001FCDA908|nr:uncharacterized protein LOC125072312 isoform X2 [Vanessa atalanta]